MLVLLLHLHVCVCVYVCVCVCVCVRACVHACAVITVHSHFSAWNTALRPHPTHGMYLSACALV